MFKKWLCSIFIGYCVTMYLSGCNLGNNDMFEPEEVQYSPVQYNPVNNINDDNDLRGGELDLDPTEVKAPNENATPFKTYED